MLVRSLVRSLLFDPLDRLSSSIQTDKPALEDYSIFGFIRDDEDDGVVADMDNLDTTIQVSPIPTIRIHKDHPLDQVIGDLQSATQTRKMSKNLEEHGFVSTIQQRTNHKDLQNCLFACFLSQEEPKKVIHALKDPSWIEAMQEELLQFKLQEVWTLVDLPNGKRAIGSKWVFKNKKDERGIVIRNKARLVAQGYTQEEGIDYDEVFAPVARIEAIRLFLAYDSFKDFVVYQMDLKSAFICGKIEEEVHVCQPPRFEDPDFPDRVYKVKKAPYGLHQAPRAWYETLSTYLLDNGFQRGKIDILLVQVYVDDIIFGSTKKELCNAFDKLMHEKFHMSSMGELTFFLGLQVQQKKGGIFISQDKYVVKILKKFRFIKVKTASTPIETQKPLLKDEDGEEVDVHMYRSMIGSLMYLTSLRPDIMFVVCACARYQVNPKVSHLHAVKRIFSDYAGASLDRKSTTIGCQFLGCRLISCQCKKQTVVANSITEAEYVAASSSDGFEQIMDFLNAQPIRYALMVNPTIYISCIEQFWSTGMVKTINGEVQLHALVDGKKIIISEASVRRDLKLEDEEGIDRLPNSTIFEQLALMGSKTTAWNEFSSIMASVPQPSDPSDNDADAAVHKELGDSLVRATTTASSLKAEQDSGNITKTRSKATSNESSSLETTSGGGSRGNTLQSDENRLKLNELIELCTNLQKKVLNVEKTKTTQANEIPSLKRRVKKLEKKRSSRTHKLNRLYKVGLSARVESSGDEEDLDDVDNENFDVDALNGEEVFVAGQSEKVVEEVVDAAQVSESTTTKSTTISSQQSQDKGKGIMTEEPVKPMKKKDLIRLDEELKIQREQEELSDAEKATLFQQLLEKRRKHFAAKRAEEKRNKPPTQAQQRKIICTYLKNMEGKKLKDLKNKSFDSNQKMFDRAFKRVNTFVDFRTDLVEGSSKRAGEELIQESSKKQKVDDDKETTELKQCMEIIPDEEEVTIDAIPLDVKSPRIVDWKIHEEGKKSYYQIIRADGISQMYMIFSHMLKSFDREDLETLYKLIKAKYKSTRPVEDLNLIYMLVEKRYPLTPPTITDMLNKKLQGRIVGIKILFNAASIIAAHIRVNAAQWCSYDLVSFAAYAARVGFHHSRCDSSLFIYRHGYDTAYLLLYVDDIVLTASSSILLQQYATEVLERANMLTCNPCRTPVDTYIKITANGDPVSDLTLYRRLAGALKYLRFTRPDISYVVQQLYSSSASSWWHTPMKIGAKAKYRGVANEVAETCWLHNLLRELYTPLSTVMIVYCDNVSVAYLSSNLVQHQRMKHIENDIHFVRGLVTTGHVRVLHVPSCYIFTKGLPNCFV
ncbi:putative ribonuclease H-like domain-containing protein [Tanacetum coccineum]